MFFCHLSPERTMANVITITVTCVLKTKIKCSLKAPLSQWKYNIVTVKILLKCQYLVSLHLREHIKIQATVLRLFNIESKKKEGFDSTSI